MKEILRITSAIIILTALLVFVIVEFGEMPKQSRNFHKVEGFYIDLPEEIRASTPNDLMKAQRIGDTIFIEFQNQYK